MTWPPLFIKKVTAKSTIVELYSCSIIGSKKHELSKREEHDLGLGHASSKASKMSMLGW